MNTPNPQPERELDILLRSLSPRRQPGDYGFVQLPDDTPIPATALASFREAEGLSLVMPVAEARARRWPVQWEAAWISLGAYSALDAVGLTAALAAALGQAGIACNVIAACHHDHLLVPCDRVEDALAALGALQAGAAGAKADADASASPGKLEMHAGGCHCGAVRFEVELPPDVEVEDCNCSICRMSGFMHLIVPRSRFRLVAGESQLSTYRFNTGVAEHRFCARCGIKPFYVPRSNPDGIDVNLRCLDHWPEGVRVLPFDGRNWEANAASLAHKSRDPDLPEEEG